MTINFKPLLAYTIEDTAALDYPVLASVKLDGIRMIVLDGVCYSRSMKPIRSKAVQRLFGKQEYNGYDGEVCYGPANAKNVFNVTTTAVMGTNLKEGWSESELKFYVFDNVAHEGTFRNRLASIYDTITFIDDVEVVHHVRISCEDELLNHESLALADGFEGLMVRSPDGRYKQGRSTAKEGIIGKLKRFSDDEAVVIGFEEKMINTNEAKKNELGRSQRSQAQEGMVGAGTLGAIICECKGIRFTMGSGMNDAMRDEVWNNKDKYLGKLATFKHFAIGAKESFRFPIFKFWRDEDDTSV